MCARMDDRRVNGGAVRKHVLNCNSKGNPKMKSEFDTLYGSKYMSASELDDPIQRTIGKVEITAFEKPGEPTKRKALLWFKGEDRALVLNKTNAAVLAHAYGKDFRNWVDSTVEIRSELVNFAGRSVPGIRLSPVRRSRSETAAPTFNDEVPF